MKSPETPLRGRKTRRNNSALFLLGEGEAPELQCQTHSLATALDAAGRDVTVEAFTRADGDAHCQVTNLRLAHLIIFDWLDHTLTDSTAHPGS